MFAQAIRGARCAAASCAATASAQPSRALVTASRGVSLFPSSLLSCRAPSSSSSSSRLSAPSLAASQPSRGVSDDIVPKKVVQHPYITGGKKYMPGFSFPAPRKLEQIVKFALLERESPKRIAEIWNTFHETRLDALATTWTKAEYEGIAERKRRCPRFVYPVLKGDGKYFTLIAEWQDNFCIFTFLDDYRRNPSGAEPYLSMALYDDFLARKGIVLVRGDFSGHLTKRDAAHLFNLVRHFYFEQPKHLETFNRDPSSFDWNSYLREMPQPPAVGSAEAGKIKMDASLISELPAAGPGVVVKP